MPLTLADISAGAGVFLDANVLVYHFAPHPVLQIPCQQLLERCTRAELIAYTSAHVVPNVAHRHDLGGDLPLWLAVCGHCATHAAPSG